MEILSRKSSASSTGSVGGAEKHRNSLNQGKQLSLAIGSSDQKRHDEHSIKSVRAKIAMFSTQNSLESPSPTSCSSTINTTTPSPTGTGGSNRNSLSGNQPLRGSSSVITPTTSTTTQRSSQTSSPLTRSLTHGDVRDDDDAIELASIEASALLPPASAKVSNSSSSINQKHSRGTAVGATMAPYHRSMINVSSHQHDRTTSPQQNSSKVAPPEKSASHADLSKSNELSGGGGNINRDKKTYLTRVASSEDAATGHIKSNNKSLHNYNNHPPASNHQHGRSQSLLEIGSKESSLGDIEHHHSNRGNMNVPSGAESSAMTKSSYFVDGSARIKIVSDRSRSSSALLTAHQSSSEEPPKSNSPTHCKLIEARRRHTLTKLKGNNAVLMLYR